MSAQPADAAPHRVMLPRTIRAVRSALNAEQQEQFAAELEDMTAGGLPQVVERWWVEAVVNLTPMQNFGHSAAIDGEIRIRLGDLRNPGKPRHWSQF